MSERIVFLDTSTIGPGVSIRHPDFDHEWQAYQRTRSDEVVERLKGATVAITNKVPIEAAMLEQLPSLKLVAVAATGYNIVDLDACEAHKVAVANIRGYAVNTVPEHTFSLILSLRRNLYEYRAQVLDGEWIRADQFCFFNRPIHDLAASTLGIVGAGAIGTAVGRIGAAFGMRVLFHDDYACQPPDCGALTDLETLATEADVLSIHCPLTDSTRHLVNGAFLERMKNTALVVNTARGGIIDEAALADAIRQGRLGGAGIDVTESEPPGTDNPIMQIAHLPNVILTPHVAWASVGAMQTLCDQLIDNIEAFVAGREANRVV